MSVAFLFFWLDIGLVPIGLAGRRRKTLNHRRMANKTLAVPGLLFLIILIQDVCTAQKLQPLRISDDKRYIVYNDGTPFLWLGDTAWELIHRLDRKEVNLYLSDRASKGFTMIQTVILAELDGLNTPNAYGHRPLIRNDPAVINEDYFDHVDYVLRKAEELGLYVGLLPTWGDKFNLMGGVGPLILNPQNAEVYGKILARRYAGQDNIIWILGGDRMPQSDVQYATIRSMAKGIRSMDSTHLMTYHPRGGNKATDAFNEPWLDFDMFQAGHTRQSRDYRYVAESHRMEPPRPVVNGEPRYENIQDRFWEPGIHDWLDDADVRVTAYWTMISGAAGYTYGCNDVWQMYSMDRSPVLNARTGWKEALHLPGPRHMGFLKDLFTALPWQKMQFRQDLIAGENPEDSGYIVCAMGQDKDFLLAYTPEGRAIALDLSPLNAQTVRAYWFNPRSGRSVYIGELNTTESHLFEPWARGRGSDFVLVVLDADASFGLPG